MSFLRGFLNQTATLESYAGTSGFGKSVFSPARTIKVHKTPSNGVKRSATGTDVDVETYYMTDQRVTVQDRLDGLPVRRVRELVDRSGKYRGCEVWA